MMAEPGCAPDAPVARTTLSSPRVPPAPPRRLLLAVALVAGCTLALQVLITRLLSAVLFYHFGFLAISLALLGTGAAALLIYVFPSRFAGRSLEHSLSVWAAVLAVLLVLAPAILVRLDYSFSGHLSVHFVLMLALVCVVSALPFLAAGVVIALAIRGYTAWASRVYAFDLVGAGIGAVVVVPLLWTWDAPRLILCLGLVASVASALFAGSGDRRPPAAAGAVSMAGLVVGLATSAFFLPLDNGAPKNLKPVADRWTPLSRVVGYPPPPNLPFGFVFYDKVYAPVIRYHRGDPLPTWRQLHLGPQSIGYALTGPGRALVIGGGGGRDIENALSAGQRRVDVIELNRAIRDVVDGPLGRWSGSPYTLPRVHTVIGDGRSTLAARSTRYDQIHIGFTDTLSANSAEAFGLTENNLYTRQAFEEYFDHLKPDGILSISRLRRLVGDEALRATVLMLDALAHRGIAHPARNVVVVLGRDVFGELFGTVLGRLRPYTRAELTRIRRLARQRGEGVAFASGGPYRLEWRQLARAPSLHAFCTSYRLDVCAPTDDKPFFFNMRRVSNLWQSLPRGYVYTIDPVRVLLVTVGILLALAALAFVVPLAVVRRERPPLSSLTFFAAIGLGFLLLEIVLIQRFVLFLGFPTYALSVVLFALLVFTGVGARLSSRWADPRRALAAALGIALALIVLGAFALQPLLGAIVGLPFAVRIGVSLALLLPVGMTLGTAMPIGLGRLEGLYPRGVPWAWGINGVASVLASALGVAVAIIWGFEVATLLAAACYVVALWHVLAGRWPSRVPAAAPAPPVPALASSTSQG
jgi:Spermine/spermidine synthase domain